MTCFHDIESVDLSLVSYLCFFFNATATTEIYTLSLHDALPIWVTAAGRRWSGATASPPMVRRDLPDRKSTRLNSSHVAISYAGLCLKKKTVGTAAENVRLEAALAELLYRKPLVS